MPQPFPDKVWAGHLKLIKWTEGGKTKRFYLIDKIAHKWHDIGQLAGLSLHQLQSIATEHRDNPINCCSAVLGKWLENPPKEYPNTWNGLIELLEDCFLSQVAKELKNALTEGKVYLMAIIINCFVCIHYTSDSENILSKFIHAITPYKLMYLTFHEKTMHRDLFGGELGDSPQPPPSKNFQLS